MEYKKFRLSALLLVGYGLVGLQAQTGGTFTDSRDSIVYRTVTIGNQIWMAENLKYLPSVVSPVTGSTNTPYYYVNGFDDTDVNAAKATNIYRTYGVLYNWPAAMAGSSGSTTNPSGVQGVCPSGWHLPSDSEWTTLITYLGGDSVAGGILKEIGIEHWSSPNTKATNEAGFKALPGGYRFDNGMFRIVGSYGLWWSATDYDSSYAWYRGMGSSYSNVLKFDDYKKLGLSVRCVRD